LTKSKESVKIIIKEKSVTVQQRFTWFLVTDQESNLFLARAVAFFDVYFSEIYTKIARGKIGYFVEGMKLLHHH